MTERPRRKISAARILILVAIVALAWVGLRVARGAGVSYLHSWVEERASSKIGATVTIGRLEVDLLPLALRASEVQVTSVETSAMLARADRVEVGASWGDLRSTPRRLRSLTIAEPRLVVERREDGSLNWPTFSAGESGAGLAIDRIVVRGAAVELDDRVLPLDLDMRQVSAHASGSTNERFAGRLDAAEVVVGLSTGATYVGALSARGAWESGRLRVVKGRVSGPDLSIVLGSGEFDLGDKSWSINFEADGEAALFSRLGVGDRGLAGEWRFSGELSREADWRLVGRVSARDVGWDDFTLARLDGDLTADPSRFSVAGIEGRFARGAVRADVEVAWADPGRPVRIEAQLTNGSLPALLTKFDLDLPELAGSWGGRGHYVFQPEQPLAGSGAADVTLRAQDRAGTIAWRRRVPIDIRNGVASFRMLTTDTERERISAQGTYDLEAGQAEVDYRVDTERVASWMRLVGLGQDPASAAWLPSAGQGSVAGSLHVRPGDWWSRLMLDLQEVSVGKFSPATVRGPLSVSAEGVRDMRLEMGQFEAAMVLAGAIDTPRQSPPRFRVGVEASGWPVGEILDQLGLTSSLSGPLEGSARIEGTADELRVESYFEVAPAVIGELPVDRVEADLELTGGTLRVKSAAIEMPAGRLRVAGALPLGPGEIDLDIWLRLEDLSASPIGGLLPAETSGTLDGHGKLAGTLERPALTAEVESSNLRLGGQDLAKAGPSRMTIRLAEEQLALEGSLGTLLALSGGGSLTSEAADLEVAISSDSLAALLALTAPDAVPGLSGGLRGVVRLSGGFDNGLPLPEARLDELTLSYAGRELSALEPVRVVWRDGGLDVESFFLGEAATDSEVFLFGRVSFADGGPVDLQGQVSLDTEWFEPLLPGWGLAGGRFEALASVGGTLGGPEINGQGEVRHSRVGSAALPQPLRDVQATVLFYPDQIVIDGGRTRFAGGKMRVAGAFDPFDPSGFRYRFQIAAEDVQLRYPEGWQVRGDAELVVASEQAGQVVRGQVTVDRAFYTSDVPIGLTQLLQTAFSRRIELVEESDEFLVTTRLDVNVRGEDALSVRNNVATLRGDFDFVVRGNLARPVIFGSADVEPGGTLVYAGNTYDVERASLKFANPYRIEPVIDLVATTRLAEYDVTLDLSGTLDRLDVNFASNPPLADLEVLALLAGGEAPQSTDYGGRAEGDSSGIAESFLYNQAASVVAARFNRLFGLDKFRIDPLTGDSGNLSSARVTVGKRLGRDLFATYSYDPSQSSQQILELEWRVSRELTVVVTENGDDSYAVDLRWDKSF